MQGSEPRIKQLIRRTLLLIQLFPVCPLLRRFLDKIFAKWTWTWRSYKKIIF